MKKLLWLFLLLPVLAFGQAYTGNGNAYVPGISSGNGNYGPLGDCFIGNGPTTLPSWQGCSAGGGVASITGSSGVTVTPTTGAAVATLSPIAGYNILANCTGSSAAPAATGIPFTCWNLGTSQFLFNSYAAQQLETAQGTSGTPVTANGPALKISNTENYGSSACGGNYVANECNAALVVESNGGSTDYMQVAAIYGGAQTTSTIAGAGDAVGLTGVGVSQGSTTKRGTGAYVQGSNYSSVGAATGIELRVDNETTSNCTQATYAFGAEAQCDGVWLTAQSHGGTPTYMSSAIHVGGVAGSSGWGEGITLNNSAIVNTGFNDQSSSATAFKAGSGHTTAFSSPGFSIDGSTGIVTTPTLNATNAAIAQSVNGTTTEQYVTDPGGGFSVFYGQLAGAGAAISGMAKGFESCVGYATCGGAGTGMTNPAANSENTAVGWEAGSKWTTAQFNTVVGVGSLRWDATGGNNAVLGVDSLETQTETNNHDNAVVGVGAIRNGGSQNVAMGTAALQGASAGSTANSNVAIGYNSLSSTSQVTGSFNVAIGTNTLDSATGNGNTAVGYNTAVGVTTATGVTVIGNSAANSITTGGGVTAVGANALNAYTGSNGNDAFGNNAGEFISTGNQSVAIGSGSQQGIVGTPTTGSFNASLGYQSLFKCQGGCTDNTAIGYLAGDSITTGQQNQLFGWQAGASITTGQANVVLGMQVGSSTLTTGQHNILIGTSNAVTTPASGSSNEINIEGLLFYNTASVAAPAVTACGTSPSIDAHANNRSGTVTVGTGTDTSCTVTFAGSGYTTWNHCRVTPQAADAGFAYSYTKTVITVTATSLTSELFDYDCDGY